MKLKVTLRDLFWLMLVVACCVAWGIDRWQVREDMQRAIRERDQAIQSVESFIIQFRKLKAELDSTP
jgi:hypothetical protein